jgi:hypothetical protein
MAEPEIITPAEAEAAEADIMVVAEAEAVRTRIMDIRVRAAAADHRTPRQPLR